MVIRLFGASEDRAEGSDGGERVIAGRRSGLETT